MRSGRILQLEKNRGLPMLAGPQEREGHLPPDSPPIGGSPAHPGGGALRVAVAHVFPDLSQLGDVVGVDDAL